MILTPHIGGSTVEAQRDIGQFVAGKLRDYVVNGTTILSVNLQPVTLDRRAETLRLARLHRNLPGVLGKVNGILGEHGVKVLAEALGTAGEVGYLLAEVEGAVAAEVAQLPETIRTRLI